MRILITGGAGCLGSNLIEKYLREENEILVIDNFATGKRQVLPDTKGLAVMEGSIADGALVDKAFAEFKPTHVINSAASYKDVTNWSEDANTNVLGAINVAKASLEYGVKKLINLQTALCYGRPTLNPIPVSHPTAPFTSYGISKTAGENYLLQSGLPIVSLRLANICGPRLSIGPIPTFYKRLKAGQSVFCSDTVRDFLDMSDFISLMDIILESDSTLTGVYNVSTGEGHSIKEVLDEISEYIQISIPEVSVLPAGADDVQSVVLDSSQTESTFSWKAKIGFKETIRRQIDWYDKYGVNDIYTHLAPPK
jgi:UDP-glucose 4-epimerase